jgi:hypothetical protein
MAGMPFTITVSAVVNDGVTLDSSYSATQSIAFSGPSGSAVYPSTVTFASGQATASINLATAETTVINPNVTNRSELASSALTVNPGVPAQLAFTQQPGGGVGGTVWAQQAVLVLRDSSGSMVTGAAQDVTLAIQNNTGGGTLSGTSTVAVNHACLMKRRGTSLSQRYDSNLRFGFRRVLGLFTITA